MPAGGGRLVVCPTPIGNLEDVTLRVLRVLGEADVVAAEDTRHTRKLLNRHGIEARLVSFHEHNERERAPQLAERVAGGETVALVSDAGTPGVSDPGFVLVRECLARGLVVEVLPGPTAIVTALVASGLPADRWRFTGFLPRKQGELRAELEQAAGETLVAFESPARVGRTLAALAALDPDRDVAVCRELTKLHEEVARGRAADLAERFADGGARGEIVLVIGPAAKIQPDPAPALAAVEALVAAGARRRAAAKVVSGLTGVPANRLYRG